MTEDWEESHLPLDDPRAILPPGIKCEMCDREATISKTVFNGIDDITFHYCGTNCAHAHHLKNLRGEGL